jgi:glutathione S-transferase
MVTGVPRANAVLHEPRGDEEKAAPPTAELLTHLRRMEDVLGDGPFFGGDGFGGLLDVAFVPFSSMFYGTSSTAGSTWRRSSPRCCAGSGGATRGTACSRRESICTRYTRNFMESSDHIVSRLY